MILHAAALLFVLLSALGLVYTLAAIVAVTCFARRERSSRTAREPVTVLKPLHGSEPGLFERLASICRQDYLGPVQIICGVQDPTDPAIQVVRSLQSAFPEHAIELALEPRRHGVNRKISNLIGMYAHVRHDVIVLADSDMEVGPSWLADVLSALAEPGVGAVTCAYHGVPGSNFWAHLSALGIDAHFLPNAVAGLTFRLARPCFGSTIAMRCSTLDEIGGFRAFQDQLADDYAIGTAVRARGLRVGVPPFSIGHFCGESTGREFLQHELRWARTVRAANPSGYAGLVLTQPFPFALLGAVAGNSAGLKLAIAAVFAKLVLCRQVRCAFALPRYSIWLIVVRDLVSFGIFLLSYLGQDVYWRGHRYRVTSNGTLAENSSNELADADFVSSGPVL